MGLIQCVTSRNVFLGGAFALILATGCGDGAQTTEPPPPSRVPTSIQIAPSSPTIDDGATVTLTATIFDQNGQAFSTPPDGFAIQWSSGDQNVASVSQAGVVTGNRPGEAQITATAGSLNASVAVMVRAVPTVLESIEGNEQNGPPASALPQQVSVRVLDRHGSGVSGVAVEFVVTAGGGSVAPANATTDGEGFARTTWTLGPDPGENRLEARAAGLTGSPRTFEAQALVASGVSIGAISPDPMIEGQNATLTGTGFSPTAGSNAVTIDGVSATVLQATATSLVVQVPVSDCRPARGVDVRVTVSGEQSHTVSHPVRPEAFIQLAVGQQSIRQNPADFCLQFDASPSSEAYLIGVQSLLEAPGSLTPVVMSAQAAAADPALPPFAPAMLPPERTLEPSAAPRNALDARRQELLRRQREADLWLRAWEREHLGALPRRPLTGVVPQGAPIAAAPPIPPTVQVGQVIPIRVPILSGDLCENFDEISTVVRAVGTHGIWLDDQANPANGFTPADFNTMGADFDQNIFPAITDYFGPPLDLDQNGSVVIVVTKEVNRRGVTGGFVFAGNLFHRDDCPSSNMGEYYFNVAPDPNGQFGPSRTRADVQGQQRRFMAHELTHVVQQARRLLASGGFMNVWEAEGQATLGEEITGHRLTGRDTGQNLGPAAVFEGAPFWYLGNAFGGLVSWYGFLSGTQRAPNAPEQCSWFGRAEDQPGVPCFAETLVYGVSWSLLRWLNDQFGPTRSGGEAALQRAFIDSESGGLDAIAALAGEPIDVLLSQWAAALYVDDRVPGADPRLTMPSWNLFAIENAVNEPGRLQPRQRSFSAFSDQILVRGGSVGYFRVSGAGRPAMAIGARTPAGASLPAFMRVWVVRLQ